MAYNVRNRSYVVADADKLAVVVVGMPQILSAGAILLDAPARQRFDDIFQVSQR